jgi:hypothetical protein
LLSQLQSILQPDDRTPLCSQSDQDTITPNRSILKTRSETFRAVVATYLGTYDPEKLKALRNRLVHNYVVPSSGYPFDAGPDKRHVHLQPQINGTEIIIVDNLVEDIAVAGETLLQEALTGSNRTVRTNVLKRANTPGILSFLP